MYNIKNCNACTLSLFRNKIINSIGNIESDIMIILDTPAKIEDEEGEALISKGNKFLLDKLECLNLIDISYITYLIKCKPPGTRQADNNEIYTCKTKHLYEELMFVKPKMIILLGSNPIKAFFDLKQSIHQLAGSKGRFKGCIYCLNYSPVMAIKNEDIKIEFISNMLNFGEVYKHNINITHSFNSIKQLYD